MANTLAGTSSPYLQQHADNPVDWQPWSQEALDRAAAEDKPLLISIGYSSCHWCHVMAHESFEDEKVAELMNHYFVCIKVDREERPDIDAIYMDAIQQLTGAGGWPLNVFATPDGKPFYAGTYFPPEPREGIPSWTMLINGVAEAWHERRHEAEDTATRLTEQLVGAARLPGGRALPDEDFLEGTITTLQGLFDSFHGGFGPAPKFPPSMAIGYLLRMHSLPMARYTLTSMASGGIFDQLAGGFSRYSVDAEWTVPHFEKMLYDNAQLATQYAEAAEVTGDASFGRIAERTLDWVLTDLADPDGGLASALDADSGGVEGSFYVWTPAQIREVLGDADAEAAMTWFGVTEAGNFEGGATVLTAKGEAPEPEQAARITAALLEARDAREHPGRDGKRIVSWNALTIEALAKSFVRLGRADHLAAAERCAALILDRAQDDRGRLLRLIPTGESDAEAAGIPAGVLEDHAHLASALVALYEASFNPRWLTAARQLADVIIRDFGDPEAGGFFSVASDHEALIARRKDLDDTPIPSGQATAALAMLRLSALTGDQALRAAAEGALRIGAEIAGEHPQGLAQMLVALDQYLAPPCEIAIVGEGPAADALVAVAREHAGASAVIAAGPPAGDDATVPLLAGRGLVDGQPAAYVCENFTCKQPVTTPDELLEILDA